MDFQTRLASDERLCRCLNSKTFCLSSLHQCSININVTLNNKRSKWASTNFLCSPLEQPIGFWQAVEKGFKVASVEELPESRKSLYKWQGSLKPFKETMN